jgi:hypothetical protein
VYEDELIHNAPSAYTYTAVAGVSPGSTGVFHPVTEHCFLS